LTIECEQLSVDARFIVFILYC